MSQALDLHSMYKAAVDAVVLDASAPPDQTTLRKTISLAYYAVFHKLLHEVSSSVFSGTAEGKTFLRSYCYRSFGHGQLMEVFKNLNKSPSEFGLKSRANSLVMSRPGGDNVRKIAVAFMALQIGRHKADYDVFSDVSLSEATTARDNMRKAFEWIDGIRDNDADVFEAFVSALMAAAIVPPSG